MYFFQDDIGLLVQHAQYNFWEFLLTPQAEHFAPILHALSYLEFKLFYLNFYGYLFVSTLLHFINLAILYRVLRELKLKKIPALIVSSLFIINLTYVEPLLWFSAQGVILANIFIAASFYFWLKKSALIYLTFLAASFSYSTGLGLGIIFTFLNLTAQRKFDIYSFLIGIFSVLIGPVIAGENLGKITPVITNPLNDFLLFNAFVIGGVGRGVIGRLFLPGFEPRHFEIVKTVISFLPFAVISAIILKLILVRSKKLTVTLISLSVLIIYPYIWAGAIRFHFGIKQALSERYAYTPLFFTVVLIGILLKYFADKKIIKSYKSLAFIALIILLLQSFNFYRNAQAFENRPQQTKKYIEELKLKIKNNRTILDGPLPSYINQPLKVSDLYPILTITK